MSYRSDGQHWLKCLTCDVRYKSRSYESQRHPSAEHTVVSDEPVNVFKELFAEGLIAGVPPAAMLDAAEEDLDDT